LGDPNALADAARGVDVLYHCAAENSPHAPPSAFSWINVAATENVLNAARHAGVPRVVHLSCTDATLIDRDRLNWKESHALAESPLDELCRSKLLAEELALQGSDAQLQVCVLRPAWVWGPGDRRTLPALCREAQRGRVQLCGGGDNLVASVYIDNLVHALELAATAPAASGQVFHVLDTEALTAREFLGGLCQALGLSAPARGLYPLAYARAWLNERLHLQHALARTDVVRRGRGTLFDGSAAVRDLGYQAPVSVEQGLQDLATWAAAIGGRDAIAKLARPAATQADVQSFIQLAS
jgi:nucleoside-diphosphate-sugar epimerase